MYSLPLKSIIRDADPAARDYRFRILYLNTLNYLKSLYPMKIKHKEKAAVRKQKKKILALVKRLQIIEQNLKKERAALFSICPHPVEYMLHGEYAVSGSSRKFAEGSMHESFECTVCGYEKHFEAQGICQEYRDQD